MSALGNPRKWRCTWEALAHIPTLRVFIFSPNVKPVNQCKDLKVSLKFEESLLLVSWFEEIERQSNDSVDFQLRVPVPRVLVDLGSPVDFRAMEDHIEVKLVLLLPVDHPLAMNFDSVLNLSDEGSGLENGPLDQLRPLPIDSDIKCLSSQDEVHFYCKSCSNKLTRKPLRSFLEMPSANWREVADNWFGACCCSFGGVSEKLVSKYANSYICAEGTCLLDATSVIVSKDDLVAFTFPDCFGGSKKTDCRYDSVGEDKSTEFVIGSQCNGIRSLCCGSHSNSTSDAYEKFSCMSKREIFAANVESKIIKIQNNFGSSFCISDPLPDLSGNVSPNHGSSAKHQDHSGVDEVNHVLTHDHEGCSHGTSVTFLKDEEPTSNVKLLKNQKSFLNGFLGNGFMVRTPNLSKDVEWIEYRCPQCSSVLGDYPSASDGHAPLDGGVRFFKCYTSTGLPVGGLGDVFRRHTLQRMFVNQLMENANDELSFRTVVRDLQTRSPILQIVLLNSNVWCCTSYCMEREHTAGPVSKLNLHPVVKVLFSDCNNSTETQSRMIDEWVAKNQADEAYMLRHQVEKLIESLKLAQDKLPFSCSYMQGLSLSSMER